MEGCSAQVTALEQGRGAGYAQHLNNVLTQHQTLLQAEQDQRDRQCEMLARVKEFDGDDDKLSAELSAGY